MLEKKLFTLNTIFQSGNTYKSDDVYKIEPEKMAHNISSFRDKFKDIKIKFRCVVVDKCTDPAYLVEGDEEIVAKMGMAIASALQLESKIEYGEDLTCE
ncbi:MAG: hypothetical protein IKA36_00385 [Clostridia bacterium]|nr:hypothetical protein [Clostridia bacterium]